MNRRCYYCGSGAVNSTGMPLCEAHSPTMAPAVSEEQKFSIYSGNLVKRSSSTILPPPIQSSPSAPHLLTVDDIRESINDPYIDISFGEAQKRAVNLNQKIVIPNPNQLFLDIDNSIQYDIWKKARNRFYKRNNYPVHITSMREQSSKSRGHWHIYLELNKDVDDLTRIFYQSLMGSDPIREQLSYLRVLIGDPHPTIFFEDF